MNTAGTVRLSARLRSIADLVTEGCRVADVGTDHAYLPIALCLEERIPSAVASDLREGPLAIAGENVRRAGLEDRITLRLSDGLRSFRPDEADTLVIAGMGGRLIRKILEEGAALLGGFQEILLQPQSEIRTVRQFLTDTGMYIAQEACTEDDGKYYPVIRAVWPSGDRETAYSEEELAYGPCLLREKDPVLKRYLQDRTACVRGILDDLRRREGDAVKTRVKELEEEMRLLAAALDHYEM